MLIGQAKTDYQRDYMRRRRKAGLTSGDGKTSGVATRRFRILQRDNFRCQYCGKTARDDARLEIDHIIPLCKGGTEEDANLITACFECNRSKGGKRLNYDAEQSVMCGLTTPADVRPKNGVERLSLRAPMTERVEAVRPSDGTDQDDIRASSDRLVAALGGPAIVPLAGELTKERQLSPRGFNE